MLQLVYARGHRYGIQFQSVCVCVCVQQVPRQRGQDCKDSHALQQKQAQKAAEPQAKMPKPNSKSLQHPMEVISAFLLIRVWCLVCFVMVVKGRFWEGSAGLPCPTPQPEIQGWVVFVAEPLRL